ncbi:hypothetical protein SS1G_14362 [Sclerotinia sclerotiorum 1980 UF-70]|uniref:S-adenosyl-L-methionine-dependent methyltransferase n=1 Tax=Sclerotinia sclerotiorum (strain ATCC 18683 / 1980 / Ss-1) TaxID=665079 RepID=A7F9T1_SCLS1|nr:hypothetical protein SS1G_14362 [Sclerotinia sclerotiorum 1980 UF-70]EDO00492.1 hypothetical protein SS1G_14362 [Sclerotinia sclerotiorum 1980 UF-70]
MATSQEAIDAFNAAGTALPDIQNDTFSNPIEVDGRSMTVFIKPNDDDEQDRMDLLHHVFNLVLDGKLYLAPIEDPQRVLDVGTGTGIWAIDFAEYGLVTSVEGYHQTLNSNHGYSDDGTGDLAPSFQKWQAGLDEASKLFGRDLNVAMKFKDWLDEAGFEAVVERHWKLPMAPWARDRRNKEIGLYMQQNMLDATVAYGMAHFTRILGWTPEEYQVLAAGVRNEFKDSRVHNWCNMYIVYGCKPMGSGAERNAPATGAPVLSGFDASPDTAQKSIGTESVTEKKTGDGKNIEGRKKVGDGNVEESDIAAVVKEAGENVMAQGKGKSKVLEAVKEGVGKKKGKSGKWLG